MGIDTDTQWHRYQYVEYLWENYVLLFSLYLWISLCLILFKKRYVFDTEFTHILFIYL